MKRSLSVCPRGLSLAALIGIGGTSPSALAQSGGDKTLIMALDQSECEDTRPRPRF